MELCERGHRHPKATRLATELNDAMSVLSTFDEGPDLVLYYKELMSLEGRVGYDSHFNASDALSRVKKRIFINNGNNSRTGGPLWVLRILTFARFMKIARLRLGRSICPCTGNYKWSGGKSVTCSTTLVRKPMPG